MIKVEDVSVWILLQRCCSSFWGYIDLQTPPLFPFRAIFVAGTSATTSIGDVKRGTRDEYTNVSEVREVLRGWCRGIRDYERVWSRR